VARDMCCMSDPFLSFPPWGGGCISALLLSKKGKTPMMNSKKKKKRRLLCICKRNMFELSRGKISTRVALCLQPARLGAAVMCVLFKQLPGPATATDTCESTTIERYCDKHYLASIIISDEESAHLKQKTQKITADANISDTKLES